MSFHSRISRVFKYVEVLDPAGPLRISPALGGCRSIRTAVDRSASYRSSYEARPLRSAAVRGGLRSRLTADA